MFQHWKLGEVFPQVYQCVGTPRLAVCLGGNRNRKMVLRFEFRAPCDGIKRKLVIVRGR